MIDGKPAALSLVVALAVAAMASPAGTQQTEPVTSLAPATFARVGTVDERFQSYNVEMVEVTGGRFWKPYGPEFDAILQKGARAPLPAASGAPQAAPSGTPAGVSPDLFQYRP